MGSVIDTCCIFLVSIWIRLTEIFHSWTMIIYRLFLTSFILQISGFCLTFLALLSWFICFRHFIATNATSTFRSIVSSYPGELVLVSIQVKLNIHYILTFIVLFSAMHTSPLMSLPPLQHLSPLIKMDQIYLREIEFCWINKPDWVYRN